MAENPDWSEEQLEEAPARWQRATTFEELCELVALFIEGESPYMPGYGDTSVAEETSSIVPYLAALNRAGLLTTDSQPGEGYPTWKQRASVDGLALEPIARRIARLSLYTDLHIVVAPPGINVGSSTPIILRDFQPHGWSGFVNGHEVDQFEEDCNATALAVIRSAWRVSVVDLVWGREEHLWRELTREICYSEIPHPDLGIDGDFMP